MRKENIARTPTLISAALVLGVCLIVLGGALWTRAHAWPRTTTTIPRQQQTVTTDTQEPDEADIAASAFAAYTVPANQPRSITIASLGVKGLVQRMGLNKQGNVAVPTNISFAGWYTGGAIPGQAGLSIIDGHVSGRTKDGIFKHLSELRPGDIIVVEFGDKTTKRFSVVNVSSVPLADAARVLFAKRSDIPVQLNLITCGGTYNSDTKTFTHRVIAVTRLET